MNNVPTHFLILGVARSGTTLLQLMLDKHSAIAVCPESDVFTSLYRTSSKGRFTSSWHYQQFVDALYRWLRIYNDPGGAVVKRYLKNNPMYKGDANHLLRRLLFDYLNKKNKRICGEKSPANIYHLPLIHRVCPELKLVILIRHPYDVICSLAKLLANQTSKKDLEGISAKTLLQASVFVKWGMEILFTEKVLDKQQNILVKYEDVVKETTTELTEICRFLGVGFESKMLQFQTSSLRKNQQEMQFIHPNLSRQINPNNTNKYPKILNAHQEQLIYRFLGATLTKIPYVIKDNNANLNGKQYLYLLWYQLRFGLRTHLWKDEIVRLKLSIKYKLYRLWSIGK